MAEGKSDIVLNTSDLDLLNEVSTAVHSIHDLDEMLQNVLAKIKDVFGIDGASIALHDRQRKELYFIQTIEELTDGDSQKMAEMRFPDDYGVAGWVLKEQQSVLIPDVTKDSRFTKKLDLQQNLDTRSMICVPLKTRKRVMGVLYAINKLAAEFSQKDLRLLEVLSVIIAVSIENARLYGEVRQYASSLEKENYRLKTECQARFNVQGIIGCSAAMQRVFALLDKVIDTDTAIMIQGETGTGKELLAKVIHYNGPLKNKPFVAENCGALSENLLESEIFGHVKGAFTGAIADKKGLFEMANGGTVFLDEISDMPFSMQTKLLRVLQENQIRPVGGSRYRQVNFRLLSSSNRDLFEQVEEGSFREDLFYRIQVFPIVIPPLRERREDIPLLATHFLEQHAARLDRALARLTPAALEALMQFDWPGNVRQLENEIERALTLAGSDSEITPEYLSERVRSSANAGGHLAPPPATLKEATAKVERQMVMEALRKSGGNRSQAARELGLTRQGLLNKIARYEIKL
ncbi:MAG: sigma 54-interacting transcriptional regulator [Deltaproteobacteria bacterium]|nr:sigma 54-interacting transcriptional regulator [Deltaproteobacteria bacterium]